MREFDELDEIDKRVALIFSLDGPPDVNEKSLATYLSYLRQHLKQPCTVTGIEDFPWEERYVFGYGSEKEYKELKKTHPSHTDKFKLVDLDEEIHDHIGILANVRRISDKRKFQIPLADLKATDEQSDNYRLLDDYSVWFVNNR